METPTTTEGIAPTENAEVLREKTSELVTEHKKRGRKPGSKNRTKEQVQPNVVDPALQVNLEFVKTSVAALAGTVDAVICRKIANKARHLGCDAVLTDELWREAGLSKQEVAVIGESTALIFQRHELLMRHAPEVMLLCVGTSYIVRTLHVLKRLDDIEQKVKKVKSLGEPATQN